MEVFRVTYSKNRSISLLDQTIRALFVHALLSESSRAYAHAQGRIARLFFNLINTHRQMILPLHFYTQDTRTFLRVTFETVLSNQRSFNWHQCWLRVKTLPPDFTSARKYGSLYRSHSPHDIFLILSLNPTKYIDINRSLGRGGGGGGCGAW